MNWIAYNSTDEEGNPRYKVGLAYHLVFKKWIKLDILEVIRLNNLVS